MRPTKYEPKLADKLLEMMSQGLTKQEAAAELKISRDTMYRWAKEHKEFGESLKLGTEWSEAVNISILRQGALGKINKFNPTAFALLMNNAYGWSKSQEGFVNNTQININSMNILQSKSNEELLKFIEDKQVALQNMGVIEADYTTYVEAKTDE
jgi:DNA-binding XRE family transcriptional regulator